MWEESPKKVSKLVFRASWPPWPSNPCFLRFPCVFRFALLLSSPRILGTRQTGKSLLSWGRAFFFAKKKKARIGGSGPPGKKVGKRVRNEFKTDFFSLVFSSFLTSLFLGQGGFWNPFRDFFFFFGLFHVQAELPLWMAKGIPMQHAQGARERGGGSTLRKDVFLPSKHLLP